MVRFFRAGWLGFFPKMTAVIIESKETSGLDCKRASARLCAIWLFRTSPWPHTLAFWNPKAQKKESHSSGFSEESLASTVHDVESGR